MQELQDKFLTILAILTILAWGLVYYQKIPQNPPGTIFTEENSYQGTDLLVMTGNTLIAVSPPVVERMKVLAVVTAYNAVPEQTDADYCISASARNVCLYPEQVIACPARLPFGTKVEIDNKIYVCEDRMASRFRYQGWYFDILMEDIESAKTWGRQIREVIIY